MIKVKLVLIARVKKVEQDVEAANKIEYDIAGAVVCGVHELGSVTGEYNKVNLVGTLMVKVP